MGIFADPLFWERMEKIRKQQEKFEWAYPLVLRMFEKQFGELPDDVIERLQGAEYEQLEQWALLLLSANSLDEIFEE